MTSTGGIYNFGNVFSVYTNGTGYFDIHDFNGLDGLYPTGDLSLLGVSLYGMTPQGGINYTNDGVLFTVNTDGAGFTDLLTFNSTHGSDPVGGLTNIGTTWYGMANEGGADNLGSVFRYSKQWTGIENINTQGTQLIAEPNPANGKFTIQIVNGELKMINETQVVIYNSLGEKVYSSPFTIHNSQFTINLSNQPNGIYFYRALSDNGELLGEGKVLIER
jgi:hypothetical protein